MNFLVWDDKDFFSEAFKQGRTQNVLLPPAGERYYQQKIIPWYVLLPYWTYGFLFHFLSALFSTKILPTSHYYTVCVDIYCNKLINPKM